MKRYAIFALGICLAGPAATLSAQERVTVPQPAQRTGPPQQPPAPMVIPETDSRQTREQLRQVLQRYPPDLGRILKMDPTMLQNQPYLAQYPALASFLAAHPEVVRNPSYYLEFVGLSSDYAEPLDARSQSIRMWRDLSEGLGVMVIMIFVASMLAWLVRTLLDHRRWLRVSRVQTEVHNKLLDRFAGTADLLTYVQTPAGRRFLEAAPIPLDPAPRSLAPPLSRIIWAMQAGVVLAIGGLGFQFASGRVIDEVAQGLQIMGILAVAFGLGLILSSVISYLLSRRLGLFDTAAGLPTADRGDTTTA